VGAWRKRTTDAQIARGLELLKEFGLDHLYGAGPMPVAAPDRYFGGLGKSPSANGRAAEKWTTATTR
jgi:hypothetical protein